MVTSVTVNNYYIIIVNIYHNCQYQRRIKKKKYSESQVRQNEGKLCLGALKRSYLFLIFFDNRPSI